MAALLTLACALRGLVALRVPYSLAVRNPGALPWLPYPALFVPVHFHVSIRGDSLWPHSVVGILLLSLPFSHATSSFSWGDVEKVDKSKK